MEKRDEELEEIRLQNSTDLMYGNKDKNQVFAFDVRSKYKWVIYHEALGTTEDGQVYSKVTSRFYSFYSPQTWETLFPKNEPSFFQRQKKDYTVLHDPFVQAEQDGITLKGVNGVNSRMTLKEKLALAKAKLEQVEPQVEAPVQKRQAKRKEVKDGE